MPPRNSLYYLFFYSIWMHIAEFVDGRHQLIVGIGRAVVFISEHFLNPKHHDSKLQSWFWCWVLLLAVVLQNKWHKFKLCQTCTLVFAQSTLLHNNKLSRVKIKDNVSISRNFREIGFTKKRTSSCLGEIWISVWVWISYMPYFRLLMDQCV